ncbi:MAG: PilW family protein [Rhodocyclales bacterium]|nr:PilW family protein [Rhodocyclales bacterium]
MAIAMIGMVMMFQAMSVWEARKRTTASGSDTQVTGSIGMFTLERDLKVAGYGFGNAAALGCTVSAYDSTRSAPGLFSFQLAPVLITNGDGTVGSTLPDTIAVLYGSAPTMSSSQTYNSITGAAIRMNTRTGLRSGDLLIAADAGNAVCGLFEATGNANADGLSIDFANGTAYTNYTNNANVAASVAAAALTPAQLAALQAKFHNNSGTARFNNGTIQGVGLTGSVFNLGTSPQLNVYRITDSNGSIINGNRRFLTFTNTLINQTTATEVAEGVIDLQAEYGIDANNDGALAAAEWTSTTPATTAAWGQLRAIRIGLLARSQQFEQINVTAVAPSWAGGAFAMTNVDGTADSTPGNANDWRRYRYRVYETVIPLRNVVWGIAN